MGSRFILILWQLFLDFLLVCGLVVYVVVFGLINHCNLFNCQNFKTEKEITNRFPYFLWSTCFLTPVSQFLLLALK